MFLILNRLEYVVDGVCCLGRYYVFFCVRQCVSFFGFFLMGCGVVWFVCVVCCSVVVGFCRRMLSVWSILFSLLGFDL